MTTITYKPVVKSALSIGGSYAMTFVRNMKKRRKLLILLLLPVVAVLLAAGLIVVSGKNDKIGNADAALVLGNQVNVDGTPSPRLKARLDTALNYFRQGYYPLIIVSGGTGIEGVPEGTAMKDYLVSQGVPSDAIIVDNDGVDTKSSAVNAKAILRSRNLSSVFVVSQYFHIPRSRLALRQQGLEEIYSAAPDFHEQRDFYSVFREVPAYLKYLVNTR